MTMDRNSFEILRKDANRALRENRLLDALSYVGGMLFNSGNMEQSNELESIKKDYEMMLAFMKQGGSDPQRASIYRNLVNRTFCLLDTASRSYRLQNEKDMYADTFRKSHGTATGIASLTDKICILQEELKEYNLHPSSKEQEAYIAKQREALYETCDILFEHIWTSPILKADDAKEWQTSIEKMDEEIQAPLISAVMLSCQSYFDQQKFRLLLHFCQSIYIKVRARALTAVVWIYMRYEYRFDHHPELCEGISLLAAEPQMHRELILLQKQFVLSLETAKVERKMKDEIIPDIMKSHNYQRNKMGLKEAGEELEKALRGEPNAEWEKIYENKHLANNMKEIIEMGQEGIDINIGTFSSLKGFPFFRHICHWFTPFDYRRSEVENMIGKATGNPIRMLLDTGNFCDSDKYSLCMMLQQLMPPQRDMMITQIGAQMEGQEEIAKILTPKNTNIKAVYRNYLQDLYRFYKLYPQKGQFEDPFKTDLFYKRYPRLGIILDSSEELMDMASFLIKREYYQDAIAYIEEILKKETATAEMLQKIAFCHHHTGNPGKAIYYYQQADLLNPDNEWILKQMYLCHSALGKYEQELACLKKLEEINPEDSRLISETGLCLMQLQRYQEAANRFYELEYKKERLLPSWRAIAWCNFKMGRLEQAYKYYQKLLHHEKVTWEDYLNAGHTAWCMNLVPEAIGHYKQYVKLYQEKEKQENKLLRPFDEDREELLQHGIPDMDIALMRDIIVPGQETI